LAGAAATAVASAGAEPSAIAAAIMKLSLVTKFSPWKLELPEIAGAPLAIRRGGVDCAHVCEGTLLRSEPVEMVRNPDFICPSRARARDRRLLHQGHKGRDKAPQIAIRINFSALLFAKVSDKSVSEECLALGAGLHACNLCSPILAGQSTE
jgi:hypothetical protein